MGIRSDRQDIYTKEEFARLVLPKMERGQYRVDVDENGQLKISTAKYRWVQREDVE